MHRPAPRLLLVVGVIAWAGCSSPKDQGPPKEPPAAPTSEDTIHLGAVTGKLNGEPFTVKTARYYVDSRPGFEKVDIQLIDAETADTPCGALKPAKPSSIWLRKVGTTQITGETVRGTVAAPGSWAVHYQAMEDRWWIGVGEANSLLVLSEPGPDLKLKGVLWACFRDAAGSCVQGEFTASYCQVSYDLPVRGTEAMERPPAYLLHPGGGLQLTPHDAGVP